MAEVEQSVFVVRRGAKRRSGLPSPWSALSLIAEMPSFRGMSAQGTTADLLRASTLATLDRTFFSIA
jgi:hypothetical protein